MNEIQDINRIETEINMLKHQTAQNIIEIGKRLIEAKAMLPHGEWGKWLEEKAQFSHRTANNFMKVSLEFEDSQALANLGQSKVFALLDLPQDQRDDFIQENPIDEMTTRELQQAIKDKKDLERQLDEERRKPPQVETIIVEKEPHDYNKLKHQVQDKQLELERLQKEKQILEAKAELNKKNADRYKELKEQIETLTQQKSDIGRRLNSATKLSLNYQLFAWRDERRRWPR